MGQTYLVKLKTGFLNRESAAAALREKIGRAKEEHVNYSLDHYRDELGIGTETLDDQMKIFFGGWYGNLRPDGEDERSFEAAFDASYGWEGVMMDAFDAIAPYLEDGSEIEIYPDSGADLAYVENGKTTWNC